MQVVLDKLAKGGVNQTGSCHNSKDLDGKAPGKPLKATLTLIMSDPAGDLQESIVPLLHFSLMRGGGGGGGGGGGLYTLRKL